MKNLLCSLLVLLVVGGQAFGVSADEGDYIGIVSPLYSARAEATALHGHSTPRENRCPRS